MLIQFSVGNYRSLKNKNTFSLEASFYKEHKDHLIDYSKSLKLLKSSTIFGANASGKSNLFQALVFMHNFVLNSSNAQITSKIPVDPYRLNTSTEHEPCYFEAVFIYENIRYRYGFELDTDKIHSEWLFNYPNGKEVKLFTREKDKYNINKVKFSEGKKDFEKRTRQNALFISTVAQFNGEISQKIIKWFNTVNIISGFDEQSYLNFSLSKLKDEEYKKEILKFIKFADIDIEDFITEQVKVTPDSVPNVFKDEFRSKIAQDASVNALKINTIHKKYNKQNKFESLVPFDLGLNESEGTKKLVMLAVPIIDTLINGKTLFIDELDSRLHPLILEFIIKLFNSNTTNTKNAQLVFNTHSTYLLSREFFRRDQIWFIQKNKYGESELYSLDEYKLRNDSSFGKSYLLGKFGAIPIIREEYEQDKE